MFVTTAVLKCDCKAPVCEGCAIDCSGHCRLCGQIVDVELVIKGSIFKKKNWLVGETHRGFWMMSMMDANEFIETNLGPNWLFFMKWFLANGGVFDITKINTAVMCKHVSNFKLFCLKWVFMKFTSAFMKRIPLTPVASIFNPHFEKFMKNSSEFVGSLPFIIFRNQDLQMYRIFGFMIKIIAKITRNSVVLMGSGENQIFLRCFRRFYARLLT